MTTSATRYGFPTRRCRKSSTCHRPSPTDETLAYVVLPEPAIVALRHRLALPLMLDLEGLFAVSPSDTHVPVCLTPYFTLILVAQRDAVLRCVNTHHLRQDQFVATVMSSTKP